MKKILIVDDDATLRIVLKRHLENRGYLVQSVDSGEKALAQFEDDPPDLVVSDVMMPGMDGFEFCRRLRSTRPGQLVPLIFLSSCTETEDRVQGHQMGGDDYLVKPFEPKELIAKIEAHLERVRRTHAEILRLMQTAQPVQPTQSATATPVPSQTTTPLPLTPAEEKVFWEVIQGFTNKQIGTHLFISPRTVQTHLSNILNKLELENRSQLIRYAFEHGHQAPAKLEEVN